MSIYLLDLHQLTKRFGEADAVSRLDLQVAPGELVALLGPNGAGKTTTLRMLMGQLQPTSGTARIAGLDCFQDRAEVMRQVGYLPDDPVFYDYLSGREIIRFVGGMHGLSAATIRDRATALAQRLGIEADLGEFAVNYSKGMKKKLALLLALLHDPRLLVLDEPMNGLDPYAMREVQTLLSERSAAGCTILFSTHLMDQAEKLCQRAAIIAKGRLVADGAIAALRERAGGGSTLESVFFAVTGGVEPAV